MRRYPVRNTHRSRLTVPYIEETCRKVFGEALVADNRVTSRYGAITSLTVWPEGRELAVDVVTDPKGAAEVQAETVRRYNTFLEETTGFSAKERAKRLRKSAPGTDGGG